MIRVLIVEDELSALERIRSFKIWDDINYTVEAAARNGKEALERLRTVKPDVILTDIEMPLMNGIEMIKEIRSRGIDLPVIILSCHESFEYARQAVSLGVRDYLLKDFMEEDSVRQALEKTMKYRSLQDYPAENEIDSVKNTGAARALLSAAAGGKAADFSELRKFSGECMALIYIHIDGFSIEKIDPYSVLNEIEYDLNLLRSGGVEAVSAYADGGNFWVLTAANPVEFAKGFFSRMQNRKHTFTVAVGECFEGVENITTAAASVKELFGFRVFLGCNRIILPESATGLSSDDPEFIRKKIDFIKTSLNEGNSSACFSTLRELYERDLPGMLKYNYLEYVNLRLLALILGSAERGIVNLRELGGSDFLSLRELEQKETVLEMREWFEELFSRIFNIEKNDIAAKISNHNILRIINIIKERFDEELSLDELSEEIGVHKVYLSRLFKKEVGRNYYDYLQSYRIEKSLPMLSDDRLKIHEVAHKTGFNNYDQFAVVFKKLRGMTPSEYRKNNI